MTDDMIDEKLKTLPRPTPWRSDPAVNIALTPVRGLGSREVHSIEPIL